ncbi:hypothetical protein TNCV_154001 [Trichonephila clavipes]|nr:hypothetical protein TNCV_154001 [Trichonephila clavipes]
MGEDYHPSRRRIFLSRNRSSCTVEQFHSDVSLEAVDRRAPSYSKHWLLNDCIASSRQLVYFYRCANVGFVNSSTSAAPWIACKSAFIQDPPHSKPSMAASAMAS